MATPARKPALRTVFSSAQREFYESLAAGGGARASTGAADEGAPPPAAAPEGSQAPAAVPSPTAPALHAPHAHAGRQMYRYCPGHG